MSSYDILIADINTVLGKIVATHHRFTCTFSKNKDKSSLLVGPIQPLSTNI